MGETENRVFEFVCELPAGARIMLAPGVPDCICICSPPNAAPYVVIKRDGHFVREEFCISPENMPRA